MGAFNGKSKPIGVQLNSLMVAEIERYEGDRWKLYGSPYSSAGGQTSSYPSRHGEGAAEDGEGTAAKHAVCSRRNTACCAAASEVSVA